MWETERDKTRRTVSYVVNGFVKGYYYEDTSDPGIFPVYAYSLEDKDYIMVQVYSSEEQAKRLLELIIPAARREKEISEGPGKR